MRFLLCIALFVALSFQKAEKTPNSFFAWNGFDFEWERTVPFLGIHEGHKLGDFASYLGDQSYQIDNGELTAKASATMTFSPGVDGDIAQPATYYSLTYSTGIFAEETAKHHFAFSDNATQKNGDNSSQVVSADSSFVIPVSVTIPSGFDQYEALLTGFEMDMSCDPNKQPLDYPCTANSDSIWPTDLEVDVQKCSQISKTELSCTVSFQIARSTPSGDIPKDFNWAVDYSVDIFLTAIATNKSTGYFQRANRLVTQNSNVHDELFTGHQTATISSGFYFDQGFTALGGFGFKISSLFTHNGRNLDGYTFFIGNTTYNVSQSGSTYTSDIEYDYVMGVQAPATTLPASTKLWHRPIYILLAPGATYFPSTPVVGTVCQSDGVFLCQLHGVILDHTTTTQKISIEEKV